MHWQNYIAFNLKNNYDLGLYPVWFKNGEAVKGKKKLLIKTDISFPQHPKTYTTQYKLWE